MRRAIIDLGTNSALLLVADCLGNGRYTIVEDHAEVCRLGEGLHSSSNLLPEARARTLEVLKAYHKRCKSLGVSQVDLVGTEACRRAHNCDVLAREIDEATGWQLQIIPPDEEASLSYTAACRDFPHLDNALVVDPGGGSTEFICKSDSGTLYSVSIPIGCVVLTESFLRDDPPTSAQHSALSAHIDLCLQNALGHYPKHLPILALAGTATSLAAIDLALDPYDGTRVQGHRLSISTLAHITDRLFAAPLASRKEIVGIHPKRADVLPSGALLLLRILTFFNQDHLFTSDRGVRYGLLYRY